MAYIPLLSPHRIYIYDERKRRIVHEIDNLKLPQLPTYWISTDEREFLRNKHTQKNKVQRYQEIHFYLKWQKCGHKKLIRLNNFCMRYWDKRSLYFWWILLTDIWSINFFPLISEGENRGCFSCLQAWKKCVLELRNIG